MEADPSDQETGIRDESAATFDFSTIVGKSKGKRYWAIKTLDPDYHTLYSKVVAAYDPTIPRVNVILDEETLDLASYSVFVNGEDRTEDLDEAHVFYALIHIYDLILTTALFHATQHDDAQSLWAQQFAENTNLQYLEAKLLLFSAEGDT
eukprot:gene15728-11256_t